MCVSHVNKNNELDSGKSNLPTSIIKSVSKIIRQICVCRCSCLACFFFSLLLFRKRISYIIVCFTEEDGDEIKIGTSCKNGGCTKVCLCTNCV